MIIITNPEYALLLQQAWAGENPEIIPSTRNNLVLSWKSSQPIYTHNYHCKIRDFEYNYTYNPTVVSSSVGTVYDNSDEIYSTSGSINKGDLTSNITGSSFRPYITTVGLYNDSNELIAVGKVNRPVPKTQDTEMTIIVKIDI